MLEADCLTMEYEPGRLVLDHLSFTVHPGEIFCLFGSNGAGKTTTINLFLNFIDPTGGTMRINSIDVVKRPLEAKKHMAFVSENVMLYGNFSARQNLDFFAVMSGKSNLLLKDYYSVLNRVGLTAETHKMKVRSFSKGMRQKLGIAIAIIKDAPVILLDEPTSGLDPTAAMEFMNIMAELRSQGKAILMSTHDIFRAREIADHVGIMNRGRMISILSRCEFETCDIEQLYFSAMQHTTVQKA